VGVNYRIGKDQVVSFTLDVFNLFNFQTTTRVDESYTFQNVYPLVGGKASDIPGSVLISTGDKEADAADPHYLTEDDINPNFKQPNQYQSPRQFRVGLRYTF
jgi:TonB dependent receptor